MGEREGGRERERGRERCIDYTNKQRGKNKGATCEVCIFCTMFLYDVCSEATMEYEGACVDVTPLGDDLSAKSDLTAVT